MTTNPPTRSLATGHASEAARNLRRQIGRAVNEDARIIALLDYGSSSEGRDDEWSDVDLAVFIRDEDYDDFEAGWKSWAAQFGTLFLAFVGDIDNRWTVYDAHPAPLRVDYHLHRASAATPEYMATWPNAPLSREHMLLVDKTGQFAPLVDDMVGRDLGPPDVPERFEIFAANHWYYTVRTWCKLQRGTTWGVRFDISFIMLGGVMALLRLEAGKVDRWRAADSAANIEQAITPERLRELNACIPDADPDSLRPVFARIVRLSAAASAHAADRYGRPWPHALAERMIALTAADDTAS